MPRTEDLKRSACQAIDQRRDELVALAKTILDNPETGFNEYKTCLLVSQKFIEMGIRHTKGLALTGVKGDVRFGAGPGPRVAIIGEMDSLIVRDHPHADPQTGAAHACGHHAQIAMMLGATMGLLSPDVAPHLSGNLAPFAVPAEEFIDVERRLALRDEGKIEFMGGKQELIRIGAFNDIQMAMMCHTSSDIGGRCFSLGGTSNGHLVKYVQFIGQAAHAGAAPHLGINALNAASWALTAIHANREVLREQDTSRFHGIMISGGEVVNAVPADVRLEWRVRASSTETVAKNNQIADRCFKAGAMAVGARVKITDIPGYLPLRPDPRLQKLFQSNAEAMVGPGMVSVVSDLHSRGGSTDMGDLSHIMPVCHPYTGGATGAGHSCDYIINDYESAVVNPAKIMAMVVVDLLANAAENAKAVIAQASHPMDAQRYVSLQSQRAQVIEFDGTV